MDRSNHAAQIAISNLDGVRQDLNNQRQKWGEQQKPDKKLIEQKDFADASNNLAKGLDGLKKALNSQFGSLKNMKNIKKDTEKEGQNNENKIYLQTFMEIIEKELLMLLQICKQRFSVPRSNQRNQDLTTELREQAFWRRLEDKYKEKINNIKFSINSETNPFELIFQYLNIRDALMAENIRALLYQQQILYKDLNVPPNEFVHNEVYKILDNIHQQNEKSGFIQPKLAFDKASIKSYELFKLEDHHREQEGAQAEATFLPISQFVQLTGQAFDQFEGLVRNIFGLTNVDKEIAINTSKVVTNSLRHQLQAAHASIADLEAKIQHLSGKLKSDDQEDEESLKKELHDKDNLISELQRDLRNLNNELVKNEKSAQLFKLQFNQLQDDYKRLSGSYFPKLDETTEVVKKAVDNIDKIKKELDFLFSMVRVEKMDKNKINHDTKLNEMQLEKIAGKLGSLRKEIKHLKSELAQKDMVSFELAKAVDEYKTKTDKMTREIETLRKSASQSKENNPKILEEYERLQKLVGTLQEQLKKQDTQRVPTETKVVQNKGEEKDKQKEVSPDSGKGQADNAKEKGESGKKELLGAKIQRSRKYSSPPPRK